MAKESRFSQRIEFVSPLKIQSVAKIVKDAEAAAKRRKKAKDS